MKLAAEIGLACACAAVLLLVLMLAMTTLRVMRFRWRKASSHHISRDDTPPSVRLVLDSAGQMMSSMGFEYRYTSCTTAAVIIAGHEDVYGDTWQHAGKHTFATTSPSFLPEHAQPFSVQYATCFTSGANWLTVNCELHFMEPHLSGWRMFDDYLPSAELAWQAHRARVLASGDTPLTTTAEAATQLRQLVESAVPDLVSRGRLVAAGHETAADGAPLYRMPMWPALQMAGRVFMGQRRAARVNGRAAAHVAATGGVTGPGVATGSEAALEADVDAFMQQLQVQRAAPASRRRKLWIFAISAALFVAAGLFWMSWPIVFALLAVVALHEFGHYLAMRMTRYQNVSVFLLPGIGGVATGRKADATPFEKVLVYLAGPMPGLFIGMAVLVALHVAQVAPPTWLSSLLWVLLAINYLNLLPVTPLDGGRVVETLLFARLPVLRFCFAVICCVALFAFGSAVGDPITRVLAVVIAVGLPAQWRLMQAHRAIHLARGEALDEDKAIRRIFSTFQQPGFRRWHFARRMNTAMAMLPELQGRRAGWREAAAGLLVYAACLAGPAVVAMKLAGPQLHALLDVATRAPADDVVEAPPSAITPDTDWQRRLSAIDTLPEDERIDAWLGAARQAFLNDDGAAAHRHYRAAADAFAASARPGARRDVRATEALLSLAGLADDDAESSALLARAAADLAEPQGAERTQLAKVKEQMAWGNVPVAQQVSLLREAVALREAASSPGDADLLRARMDLARVLDRAGDAAAAEASIRASVSARPVPAPGDRSRQALDLRVADAKARADLAWFLHDHGDPSQARMIAQEALNRLPGKITASWVEPHRNLLEIIWWADIRQRDTKGLALSWPEFDDAHRERGGSRNTLWHEADRALTAGVLDDATLRQEARVNTQALIVKSGQRPAAFCAPARQGQWLDWRRKPNDERRLTLGQLGACKAD